MTIILHTPRWHGKRIEHITRLAYLLQTGYTLIYNPKEGYWIARKEKE